MISRIILYLEVRIGNLYLGIQTLANQTTRLANGSRIHKEGSSFLPSIWDMKVAVKTDIRFLLLGPQIQFLKTKIDLEEVPMGLDDTGWAQLGHQTLRIALIKIHVSLDNVDPFPDRIITF